MADPATIGPWRVERLLGQGGMARVWLARGPEGHAAAVKVLVADHPPLRRRFEREIRALRAVDHPGVVRVLDRGEADGRPWFAMTWIDGPDLRQQAAAERSHPPLERAERTWAVARGLCDALAGVHAAGWLHRDVKPSNVLLAADGRPVLIDFGVAARLGATADDDDPPTAIGVRVGTAIWAAPEQLAGGATDVRADLYGVGATLYHLATGQRPFPETDPVALLRAHLERGPVAPSLLDPTVPADLEAFILKLLARDPADRFPDARAAAAAAGAVDPDEDLAPLAGRQPALDAVGELIRAAQAGEPAIAHVEGATGAGRGWLARVARHTAVRHGVECVVVDAPGPRDAALARLAAGERFVLLSSVPLPHARAIRLDPLPVADVRRSLFAVAPRTPALAATADRLHRLSGGNAGLLLALLRRYRAGGAVRLPDGEPAVEVDRWVGDLDLDALTVAAALALAPRPLSLDALTEVAQVPPEASLPELERRGIAVRAARGWRLGPEVLRGPLLAAVPDPDALADRLGRVETPGAAAGASADLAAGRAAWARGDVTAALTALHAALALARAARDDEAIVDVSDPLADVLATTGALGAALTLARNAQRLAASGPHRPREVRATVRLGDVLLLAGQIPAAARVLADASALAKAAGLEDERRRSHTLRAEATLDGPGAGVTAAAAATDRLLPLLAAPDPRLHAAWARARALAGDHDAVRRARARVAGLDPAGPEAIRVALGFARAAADLGSVDAGEEARSVAERAAAAGLATLAWRAEHLRARIGGEPPPPPPGTLTEGLDPDALAALRGS